MLKSLLQIALILLLLLSASACQRGSSDHNGFPGWGHYKSHFVHATGKVLDTGNGNISHSEGQGYGMILAVAANDRKTFDLIWEWTQQHLQVRGDYLFAWKWLPGNPGIVEDNNNASDGDLLIAWALLRAAFLWEEDHYLHDSKAIMRDLNSLLVRDSALGKVLLPGDYGFVHEQRLTLNHAYWVYPALRDFQKLLNDSQADKLLQSGNQLLALNQFGPQNLPADWVNLSPEGLVPAAQFPARFGHEAVRIPLYACWASLPNLQQLRPIAQIWQNSNKGWISLVDAETSTYPGSRGQQAVNALLQSCLNQKSYLIFEPKKGDDYYSATLGLLANLAYFESVSKRLKNTANAPKTNEN